MRNILIPTDFSISAWNAITYALQLFANTECVFYFLNAYTPEISSNRLMAGSISESIKTSSAQIVSEKGLRQTVERVNKEFKNPLHDYKTVSSFSLLLDVVKEVVSEQKIDFIVMGSRGSSDNTSIFLGRNTVRILNNVNTCPVLVIPSDYKFENLHKISVVSESIGFYRSAELNPILSLARIFNSSVEIVTYHNTHINFTELQQDNHDTIHIQLESIPIGHYNLNTKNTLTTALRQYVDQASCQLLVMSNKGNSFIRNICKVFHVGQSTFTCGVPILSLQVSELEVPISI